MKFAFLLLFLNISFVVSAQEITVVSGNYKNLKTVSEYNLVFDYSDLTVTDFESEEAYLQKTMLLNLWFLLSSKNIIGKLNLELYNLSISLNDSIFATIELTTIASISYLLIKSLLKNINFEDISINQW